MLTLLCLVLTSVVWVGIARAITLSAGPPVDLLSEGAVAWAEGLESELEALESLTRVVKKALAIMGIAATHKGSKTMDMFLGMDGKRLVGPVTDGHDKVTVATLIWDCGQWYGVESTNLDALYHDGNNLYVRFSKGAVYRYQGVPVDVAFDLLKNESVGKAFNSKIKPFYVCEKISG